MRTPLETAEPRIGGRYQILGPLGQGGFGEVLQCRDTLTRQEVALKLLPASAQGAPLQEELAALYGATHPGVVELLDDGVHQGRPYLVMRLVEGPPFPGVPLPAPWEALAAPVTALLSALGALHARGLFHLDLKPEHVRVQEDGSVVLLDLGLSAGEAVSTLRQGAVRGGTRRYAAPEQIMARGAGAAADLYAAGVIIYEALTGLLPQMEQRAPECAAERVRRDPVPVRARRPDLPEALAQAIDALVRRRAADRPRSAWEALSSLALSVPLPALPPRPLRRDELEALILGPGPLLHVPEDAAAELERRTGGDPERVRDELGAWIRLGLASPRAEGALMRREDVDRVQAGEGAEPAALPEVELTGDAATLLGALVAAWPGASLSSALRDLRWPAERVHRALDELGPQVMALPSGLLRPLARPRGAPLPALPSPTAEPPSRVVERAWRAHLAGRAAEATALLRGALARARNAEDGPAEGKILRRWAQVAITRAAPSAIRAAHYETLRALGTSTDTRRAAALLEAAERAVSGEPHRALERIQALELSDDPELEATRLAVALIAAERAGADADERERAITAAWRWATGLGTAAARAQVMAWEGRSAYVEARYAESARLYLEALPGRDSATGVLSCLLGAAAALLELGELERCAELASDAAARAAAQRFAQHEALGLQLQRAAAWRAGPAPLPDEALVAAACALDDPNTAGPIALTEAAFAWRRGERAQAARLAAQAVRCFERGRNPTGAAAAEALQLTNAWDASRAATLARRAVEQPMPDFDWQILGLLLPHLPEAPVGWRAGAVERARAADRPDARRELLSPVEARQALGDLDA